MTIFVPAEFPVQSWERFRAETYTDVAALALLMYDLLLNFDMEVALMWPSRWNVMKVLFLLTRYLPFVDVGLVLFYQLKPNISIETCHRAYNPAGWLIVLGIMIAEIILMIRTWAIWGRSKRVGITLIVCGIAGAAPVLYIENVFLNSLEFSPYPSSATPGCLLTAGNPLIAISFVVVIIFETFLLILTLIKGVQHYRIAGRRGFVSTLYRDGILFYIYLFGVSVVNFIVIVAAPRDLANLLALLQRVLHSLLSARVIMNLRAANQRDVALPTSFNSLPTERFAHSLSSGTRTGTSTDSGRTAPLGLNGVVIDISAKFEETELSELSPGSR